MELKATPIVALDVSSAKDALRLVDRIGPSCRFYKVGSELFTAEGPAIVRALRERNLEVFLDLKFHDIPNTVRGAVQSAARLGVRLLTVHISGGADMLGAAVEAAGTSCDVLGVSVLTSLDAASLGEVWGRPGLTMETEVLRLAELAKATGLSGLVCSGAEAVVVRRRYPRDFDLLVPGIRLGEGDHDDQRRVVTPRAAVDAGATYLVLGRAVTGAADPAAAMREIVTALR